MIFVVYTVSVLVIGAYYSDEIMGVKARVIRAAQAARSAWK